MPDLDRTLGCLLGLALGDAYGAPHEGGIAERLLWRLIGRTRSGHRRWTDDTAMALAVAESLVAHGRVEQDDLARRFAADYAWSRGYGAGTAEPQLCRSSCANDSKRSRALSRRPRRSRLASRSRMGTASG